MAARLRALTAPSSLAILVGCAAVACSAPGGGAAAGTGDGGRDATAGDGGDDGAAPESGIDAPGVDSGVESGADSASGDASGGDSSDARACGVTQLYVDAASGQDTGAGTTGAPLKTITHAASLAAADPCIATIHVAAGTYDVANGEAFPLVVPANVALVGDEAGKGSAAGSQVFIHGGGAMSVGFWTAVVMSSSSTLAGFEVTPVAPPADAGSPPVEGVLLRGATATTNVTVRNCTLVGNVAGAGIYISGSTGAVVTGNVATSNREGFYLGGASSAKLESNVATQNGYGVELDAVGGDLGGGALSSAGLNTLSCNTVNDLWLIVSGVSARSNAWDHVPPTGVADGGAAAGVDASADAGPDARVDAGNPDIHIAGTGLDTSGATLASPGCP